MDMNATSASDLAAASSPGDAAPRRLVIRVKLISQPAPPASRRPSKRTLAFAIVAALVAAVALIWVATNALRNDRGQTSTTNTQVASQVRALETQQQSAAVEAPAGVASSVPTAPTPNAAARERSASEAAPQAAPPQALETAPPSPVHEVLPTVPQSALQTIRGTVRVTMRVALDQAGAVVSTTSEIPGPSRYFERLSREAAQKWTFTPSSTQSTREMLIRFHYTREGVTASAIAPE